MSKPDLPYAVAHPVLSTLYLQHPGPWRVEVDWTIEVRSRNGLVAKGFQSKEDAESLVEWRDKYGEWLDDIMQEIEG